MAGERRRFRSDTFHQIAVADDAISMMIDDGVARSVIARGKMSLRYGESHPIAESLSQRAGRGFDPRRDSELGVSRCHAAPLPEPLDFVERQCVAGEMEQTVKQHRAMPGRQNKTIAVDPVRVGG